MGNIICCRQSTVRYIQNNIDNNLSDSQIIRKSQIKFNLQISQYDLTTLSTPRSGSKLRWVRGKLIGKGSSSKVYQCINIQTNQILATKQFNVFYKQLSKKKHQLEKQIKVFFREVSLLKNLQHSNIIKYYQADFFPKKNKINLLIEYVEGGTLRKLLKNTSKLTQTEIRYFLKQLLQGLSYLHRCGIIHRDLKSPNILLSSDGILKISDFGASKICQSNKESHSLRGTPYWMAPQIALRTGHSFPSDIWSFGCLAIEMVTGRPPWSDQANSATNVISLLSKHKNYPKIPDCNQQLKFIIKACLKRTPSKRPTCQQL